MRPATVVLAGIAAAFAIVGAPGPAAASSSAASGAPIERSPDFERAVAAAIDRGVAHLRTLQERDGGFGVADGYPGGVTAIAYHTLRTCGVPADDPACAAAWRALRREYDEAKRTGRLRTYSAGLTMLAIADHALLWTPDRTKGKKAPARLVDESDRTWMNELVAYLENCQSEEGGWSYGEVQPYQKAPRSRGFDHSNTQYAAQGLRAASLLGCEVKPATWRRLAEHFVRTQGPEGPSVLLTPPLAKGRTGAPVRAKARGWAYREASEREGERPYGSMTAGSVASLVIARDELRGASSRDGALLRECDAAVESGLAWLAWKLDVATNPDHQGWHHYWLYALERACDLAGADWLGDRDWYGEGARHLIERQEPSGRWVDHAPEVVTHSYALLFLRRAARVLEAATTGGAAEPVSFEGAAALSDRDFADLVDLVLVRWRRATTESERTELAAAAAAGGERIVLPLLVRMASSDPARRRAAHAVLSRITGVAAAFDADASEASRNEGLGVYEAWYMARRGRLRCDPRRGVLTDG